MQKTVAVVILAAFMLTGCSYGGILINNLTVHKINSANHSQQNSNEYRSSLARIKSGNIAASGETPTTLLPPSISPGNTTTRFSRVSPDGNWIITPENDGTAKVQNVSTKVRRLLTSTAGADTIYGQTPSGSLILGGDAGAGDVSEVVNPRTGKAKKIPGSIDAAAHFAYQAVKSVTGHWATTVANHEGVPNTSWVDVNGHKISKLQATTDYMWSPQGNMLAAIVSGPSSSGGIVTSSTPESLQLIFYNVATNKVRMPKQAIATTTYGKVSQVNWMNPKPIWSTDGHYVLCQFWNELYIYDTHSQTVVKFPGATSSHFGFLPNDDIYLVPESLHTVKVFTIRKNQIQLSHTFKMADPIDGTVLAGQRLLVGVNGNIGTSIVGEGKIVDIFGGRMSTLVSKGADLWWYDSVNEKVYFFYDDKKGNLVGNVMSKSLS